MRRPLEPGDTNNLVTFRIDPETGLLTEASQAQTPTPVCVVFRRV